MRKARSNNRNGISPEGGFTLLELIVTITILGLVVGVLYGSLNIGLSSVDRSSRKSNVFQRVRISHEIITRELRSIYMVSGGGDWSVFFGDDFFGSSEGGQRTGEEEEQAAFRGRDEVFQGEPSDKLSFKSLTGYPDGSRILTNVSIRLTEDNIDGGEDLLLVRSPLYGPWEADTVLLASGIRSLDIRYLDTSESDDPVWIDEWDSRSELPTALEIQIGWQDETASALQISQMPLLLYLPERPMI